MNEVSSHPLAPIIVDIIQKRYPQDTYISHVVDALDTGLPGFPWEHCFDVVEDVCKYMTFRGELYFNDKANLIRLVS